MDDPYGFLRYPRQEAGKQSPMRRVRHWREYVALMPDSQAARQAMRCMDCGTPYCHSHCPVHNLIPEWNELVSDRQWQRAYQQLDSTNNFPELTGRLCPAPCEEACTLKLSGRPVTIKAIERAIAERAWEKGWVRPRQCHGARDARVSIVGSGPAGLACAQQLARAGYRVTVLEKADRPGGLLRYGIPDFRLDKRILERRLGQLRAEGVRFRTGVRVGGDLDAAALLRDSADVVVLACGCEAPRDVPVPGRRLKGVYFAMDYLVQQNHRNAGDPIEPEAQILASDRDVVVVGGGDTGSDCVGTAIRQGARSVTQVQYHEQPPVRADVLDHWPKPAPELRHSDTEQEGCHRIWGWNTVAFEASEGRISGIDLERLRWRRDRLGAVYKEPVPGQRRHLPAQLVLIAIGYAHPLTEELQQGLPLELDARGRVAANDDDYKTSVGGVFSCGDMRRGQSLVVWAIREGRQCARAVDLWLHGDSDLPRV
ncbi:MAG: glutamate synthase subunit beta [Gammaproteobacteria bacterium]